MNRIYKMTEIQAGSENIFNSVKAVTACEDCFREWEVVCVNLQVNLHIENWTNSNDEGKLMAVSIFRQRNSVGESIDLSAASPSSILSCVAPKGAAELTWRISHSGRGIPADSGCQILPQITGGQADFTDTALTKSTEIALVQKNANKNIEDEHGKNSMNSIRVEKGLETDKPSDILENIVEVNVDEHIVVKEEPHDIEYCEDFGTNFSNESDLYWGGRSLDMSMETEDDSSCGGISATSSNYYKEAADSAPLLYAPDASRPKHTFSPPKRKSLGYTHVKKKPYTPSALAPKKPLQDFWEKPNVGEVFLKVKNKEIDMKTAAERLSCTYFFTYTRYREIYGNLVKGTKKEKKGVFKPSKKVDASEFYQSIGENHEVASGSHPSKQIEASEVGHSNRDNPEVATLGRHLEGQLVAGGEERLTESKETTDTATQNKAMTSVENLKGPKTFHSEKRVISEATEFMQNIGPKRSIKKCVTRFGDYRLVQTDIEKRNWWDQPEVNEVMEQLRKKEITMSVAGLIYDI